MQSMLLERYPGKRRNPGVDDSVIDEVPSARRLDMNPKKSASKLYN